MEISTELAYIFGTLYGDGYMHITRGKRGSWEGIIHHVVGLQAKDEEAYTSLIRNLYRSQYLSLFYNSICQDSSFFH